MSRNLSEGSTSKDAAATEFGVRQLFRRPAPPKATGGTTAAYLHNIDFDNFGDETVAANTWEQITDGSNGRHFNEAWRLDGDWGVNNTGDGNFTRADDALYEAYISVYFGNAVDGDTIGAAVQWAHSSNFFHPNLIVLKDGVVRVQAQASFAGALTTTVRFWVFASAARAITHCELYIRRFEMEPDGEFIEY